MCSHTILQETAAGSSTSDLSATVSEGDRAAGVRPTSGYSRRPQPFLLQQMKDRETSSSVVEQLQRQQQQQQRQQQHASLHVERDPSRRHDDMGMNFSMEWASGPSQRHGKPTAARFLDALNNTKILRAGSQSLPWVGAFCVRCCDVSLVTHCGWEHSALRLR